MNASNVYSITTPRTPRMGPPPAPVTSPLCVFAIRWNGVFVRDFDGEPIVHGSIWAVSEQIDRLSEEFKTSVACFRTERVWLK